VAGKKTVDNPNGQNIRVGFDKSMFQSATFGDLIGHEGSHAADGSDWVTSGFADSKNPTDYQTEVDAFTVQSVLAQARNPNTYSYVQLPHLFIPGKNPYLPEKVRIWDSAWKEANRAEERLKSINRILDRPKDAGGYELTPATTTKAWTKGSKL
jgi:hypothetical protein